MGSTFNKYNEPPEHDVLRDYKPRLPRFMTPEVMRAMGLPEAAIASLHPYSTPIAYPEADARNIEDRQKFEAERPGETHIPSYMEMSYVIKGEANPAGSTGLEQVRILPERASDWHAAQETLEFHLQGVAGADIQMKVISVLDLPKPPSHAVEAGIKPYQFRDMSQLDADYEGKMVMVELSFNRVGTPQLQTDSDKVEYKDPVPIQKIHKHLEP